MWQVPNFVKRILLVCSVVLLAAVAAKLINSVSGPPRHLRGAFKPVCDGLPCREKSECGTKCSCEARADNPLGVCVAKSSSENPKERR